MRSRVSAMGGNDQSYKSIEDLFGRSRLPSGNKKAEILIK